MAGLLIPAVVDMTGHYLGSSVRRSSLWSLLPGSPTVLQPLVPPSLLRSMSSLYQRLQQMWLSPLSGSVLLEHPAVGWLNMMQLLPQQHIRTEVSPPKFEGNLPMKGTLAQKRKETAKSARSCKEGALELRDNTPLLTIKGEHHENHPQHHRRSSCFCRGFQFWDRRFCCTRVPGRPDTLRSTR